LPPIILQKAAAVDYKSVIQPSPSGFRLLPTLAFNDLAVASALVSDLPASSGFLVELFLNFWRLK